ncbi:hypothetical protein [Cohnella sp. GCM10027633]|uniref:hypothetical protein n=1 Tax=unclassified Cohnella TaxID=2636738 RepID=UPI003632EBC2
MHDVYKQEVHVGLIRGDYAWPDRKQLLLRMAKKGIEYAIVPSIVLEDAADLHVYPLVRQDGEALTRRSWMIYREESRELALVKTFVSFAGEFFGSSEDRQLR